LAQTLSCWIYLSALHQHQHQQKHRAAEAAAAVAVATVAAVDVLLVSARTRPSAAATGWGITMWEAARVTLGRCCPRGKPAQTASTRTGRNASTPCVVCWYVSDMPRRCRRCRRRRRHCHRHFAARQRGGAVAPMAYAGGKGATHRGRAQTRCACCCCLRGPADPTMATVCESPFHVEGSAVWVAGWLKKKTRQKRRSDCSWVAWRLCSAGWEGLTPAAAADLSYYEKWASSITVIMLERGVLSEARLAAARGRLRGGGAEGGPVSQITAAPLN
jgi:hypothetical protein